MTPASSKRITPFLDSPALPKPRTPAQQRAARINGAKSRGPRTPEGRQRSSKNAVKHALLARAIAPRSDFREDDRIYWSIREELVAEFMPTTFTEYVEVDSLAFHLLQLIRARKMTEIVQKPTQGFSPDDAQRWKEFHENEELAETIEAVIARCAGNQPARCGKEEAKELAQSIHHLVSNNLADVEQLARDRQEDPDCDQQFDEFDREAVAAMESLRKTIGPASQRFLDEPYVAGVLCGSKRAQRGDGERLLKLLEVRARGLRTWLRNHDDVRARMEQAREHNLTLLGRAPERAMLLQRYARRHEAAVERALRSLRAQ